MKKIWAILCLGLTLALPVTGSHAAFPERPVTIVVPFGAGASVDILGRAIAKELSERFKQPVVIENRAGAGGNVGTASVARANADGYTLLLASNGPLAANVSLYSNLPFDPLKDFTPVMLVGELPMVLIANKSAPVSNVTELVELARREPGKLNFGASNTTARVWVELLKDMGKVQVETVLYKNVGTMLTDLIGGQISYAFENVGPSLPHVQSGEIKALAVTSAERAAFAPDIPTLAESGFREHELTVWFAVLAPKGTPDDVVRRLNEALNDVLNTDTVRDAARQTSLRIAGGTSAELAAYHAGEVEKWRQFVQMAGIKID